MGSSPAFSRTSRTVVGMSRRCSASPKPLPVPERTGRAYPLAGQSGDVSEQESDEDGETDVDSSGHAADEPATDVDATDDVETDGRTVTVGNPEEAVDAAAEIAGTDDAAGVDYAWVMRTTFVVTIVVGAPLVTLLSIPVALPTWNARAEFAIRVGAVVWFVTAVAVYLYASRRR